ncbi:MAG: hypothetical protein IAG10_27125, partial [Planctomycetaceae bacterium]|nr:hypothetical protein [Planctomycetaceae bacterium]
CLAGFFSLTIASAADKTNTAKPNGNRLTYLDEPCNPWYVHRDFPKLTTPMWVGEEGVEAVVILGIDDMRGHEKWEAYLRPILNRLKQIDGRAPVSIFTCSIDPKQPHLQQWLEEGLSLEIHTIDHPCPLLKDGDLTKAKSTVDRCIDLLNEVPNNKPVCFRMPCCDSLNTLSPRFYTEIFNKTTAKGNFLLANSSVMQVFTSDDPALPRELVIDADGKEKFKKYLPTDRFFTNSIENYPYPFVVDRLCWEFPCVAPSDWAAQHFHKPHNPQTIEDWKAAIDCTVIKQGVYCLVFHPHNWIKPEQINELIDHAVTKHGKKVKFLNFREAAERLNKNVLGGESLRESDRRDRGRIGHDTGARLLDLDHDGFMDVVTPKQTRVWQPKTQRWREFATPFAKLPKPTGAYVDTGTMSAYGVFRADSQASKFTIQSGQKVKPDGKMEQEIEALIWNFENSGWQSQTVTFGNSSHAHLDGVFLRDLDGEGVCELIAERTGFQRTVPRFCEFYQWNAATKTFDPLASRGFPKRQFRFGFQDHNFRSVQFTVTGQGIRFVDIDEDGHDDMVLSDSRHYAIWLWESLEKGWSRELLSGKRGDNPAEQELPPIVRADGSNNGFWVHSRQLVWMNEDTAKSKDLVERRSFDDLLARRLGTPARPDGKSAPDEKKSEDKKTENKKAEDKTGKSAHPPE